MELFVRARRLRASPGHGGAITGLEKKVNNPAERVLLWPPVAMTVDYRQEDLSLVPVR